ncbi:MAG: L,D-transpeptidase family protein [Clostridia bacterium]|nr:L,D-transpeptidase family protein [Clostridia bacterium]
MKKHISKIAWLLILSIMLAAVLPACEVVKKAAVEESEIIDVEDVKSAADVTAAPTAEPTEEPTAEPTPDPTEVPTEAPTPEPTATPTPKPSMPYRLYLEKESFTLTIYKRDGNGDYTNIVGQYRVSHGGNRTPAGTYVLTSRERWHPFANGDHGYAQYAVMYNPVSNPDGWTGLYLHGPMYGGKDPNYLWPRYYDGDKAIGGTNTQGCLRMVVEAAKFIYENCQKGTILEIVNGSPKNTTSSKVPSRHGLYHDPTDPEAKAKP